MIIGHALELMKEISLNKDALETELNKIENDYRFCNKLRESAEENGQKLQEEIKSLRILIIQLEENMKQLSLAKASTSQIVQQMLTQTNEQAQQRMQEIEQLRAEIKILKKE